MGSNSVSGLLFDDLYAPRAVADLPAVPQVPIAPSASPIAKHCSSMGALAMEKPRETYWRTMVMLYSIFPRTDAEIAARLSTSVKTIHPSTISARRRELIQQGLVQDLPVGTRKNPKTGVNNSVWGLR